MEMPFSAPVAKEWVAKWGKQVGRHPLGTGPYVRRPLDAAARTCCSSATPNYTGTTAGYLDAIHFEFSITPTTAVLKVQSGDADLLGNYIPPANYPGLIANPQWKSQVVAEPAIALDYLFFNVTVKPFDNLLVRQAIAVGHRPRQDRQAALGHRPAAQPDLPRRPARPRRRRRRQLLRLRPGQGQAAPGVRPASPTASRTTLYSHNVAPWPTVIQSIQYDLAQIGHQGEHQAARPAVVLDADRQEGRRRRRPERLVDGLPRPVRLHHQPVQQELGDRRGHQPELLVGSEGRDRRRATPRS